MPDLIERVVHIPDLEREAVAFHRLAAAERWLVTRLHHAHADPREAGVGNIVNCGAAMYMAPVGDRQRGRPGRGVRRGGRDRGRAPAQLRPGGGGGFRGRGRRGDVARRARRRRGRRRPRRWPGTAPARPSRRWSRRPGATTTGARRSAPLRAAVAPVRHGRRGVPQPGPGCPPARAGCTRSRSCRSRSGMLVVAGGSYRTRARGGQLRPGRRLDRHHGRCDRRRARWRLGRPRRVGSTVASASRTDLESPARVLAAVATEVFTRDASRFALRTARFEGLL